MGKDDVTFGDIIADVRQQLSDEGVRIAEGPIAFRHAWWPDRGSDIEQIAAQLNSDYGIPSGPKDITEEFYAEVNAIQKSLERRENIPGSAQSQETETSAWRSVSESVDRRAAAFKLWDHIAIPFRFRGNVVFRIFSPRDIFGSPIIEAMRVNEFLQGVSGQTVRDKQEIARLRKLLNRWKLVAGMVTTVGLLLGLSMIR